VKVRKAGVDAPAVYWTGEEERVIVMEVVEGETVREWMMREGGKDGEETGRMMKAIGRTIAAVHTAGVIHGDLTTSNILIRKRPNTDKDGVPQLVSPPLHSFRLDHRCRRCCTDRGVVVLWCELRR